MAKGGNFIVRKRKNETSQFLRVKNGRVHPFYWKRKGFISRKREAWSEKKEGSTNLIRCRRSDKSLFIINNRGQEMPRKRFLEESHLMKKLGRQRGRKKPGRKTTEKTLDTKRGGRGGRGGKPFVKGRVPPSPGRGSEGENIREIEKKSTLRKEYRRQKSYGFGGIIA